VLGYARDGDVIVVHTLDRLGRTVRDTLNLIHELAERGVGVRNLADPIKVDSSNPADPMAQLAVVLLALFGQMERTYTLERAAHARAVATTKGRRVGRPVVVDPAKLAWAGHLRDTGHTTAQIVTTAGQDATDVAAVAGELGVGWATVMRAVVEYGTQLNRPLRAHRRTRTTGSRTTRRPLPPAGQPSERQAWLASFHLLSRRAMSLTHLGRSSSEW